MIFRERFFENRQPANEWLFVRQAGETLRDADYVISRRGSATHVLGVVQSGALQLETETKPYILSAGHSVFLPREVAYTIAADPENPPHWIWVNMRGKLVDSLADTLFSGQIAVSDVTFQKELEQLKGYLAEAQDNHLKTVPLLVKMLMQLSEKPAETPVAAQHSATRYEAYISNCVQARFSVSDMAAHFHCSTDTLNRLFLKEQGITPYQYYQKLRIGIAKSLLRQTALTVEDIAERLHFTDRNHFSACFKAQVGQTPVQYRKSASP